MAQWQNRFSTGTGFPLRSNIYKFPIKYCIFSYVTLFVTLFLSLSSENVVKIQIKNNNFDVAL